MTERYADYDGEQSLVEHSNSGPAASEFTPDAFASLVARVEALERRLDEFTGEADTAPDEEYDSGEA